MNNFKQAVLVGVSFSLLGAAGCGAPDYCRAGSFEKLHTEDWAPYCATFMEHVESPGNYTPTELTAFFAEHPARIQDLDDRLSKVEKRGEACFQENRQKLEYRRLTSCLNYDDEQKDAIGSAWSTNVDGWLNEHRINIIGTKSKINDAGREAERLTQKAAEAYEFMVRMDEGEYQKWADTVDTLDSRVETGESMQEQWREIVDLGADDEYLGSLMANEFGPRVADLSEEVDRQRTKHDQLQVSRRYLTFALHSAGKSCKQVGFKKARKEMKIAQKALKSQLKKLDGKKLQVVSKILPDQREQVEVEAFKGVFCGYRGDSTQFMGQPKQCAAYTYTVERERAIVVQPEPTPENPKPKKVRKPRWGNWKAVSIEEGNPTEGVDCGILHKK